MQIAEISIDTIIPYPLNNVKHPEEQISRIASSISQFGFTVPILINKDNVIIAGHGRFEAAKKIGLEKVPTIKLENLTATEERAYRILDNKLTRDSDWSAENIKVELSLLNDDGFDLATYGLDSLLDGLTQDTAETFGETYNPLEEMETIIKVGDIIELNKHRVICGDSTDPEICKILLKGEKPFMMVTDPPYGVEYDASWRAEYRNKGITKIGKVSNDDKANWGGAFKAFDCDVVYCWMASLAVDGTMCQLKKLDYDIKYLIIWVKPQIIFGRGSYHWQHEPCIMAVKGGRGQRWCGDRKQSTVWQIESMNLNDEEASGHSTQKPIECMARPIRNHGAMGDLVVDPFLGSGTTLIAADMEGRKCYGVELEPKYCQIIINRYKSYCEQKGIKFNCKINGQRYDQPQ